MKIAFFLIPTLFLIISYRKSKRISDSYVAFNVFLVAVVAWIGVSNKNVYGPTGIALVCVLVSIIGFNFFMLTSRMIFVERGMGVFQCNDYYFDYKRLYALSLIVLVLSALGTASVLRAFMAGTLLGKICTDYYILTLSEDTYMCYFKEYVLSSLRYVVLISTIIGVLSRRKSNKWLIINTIGIVILQVITTGTRYILMNVILMMLCGYSLFDDKEKITIKQRFTIIIVALLFVYLIVFLTNGIVFYLSQDMMVCKWLYQRGKEWTLLMSAMFILIFVQTSNSSMRCFFCSSDYCLAFLYLNTVIKKSIWGVFTSNTNFSTLDLVWERYGDRLQERFGKVTEFCCGRNAHAMKWGAIA